MDVLEYLSDEIDKYGSEESFDSSYYLFEPWDVKQRPQWVYEQARADGIDLMSDLVVKHIGVDPHPFQTGYLLGEQFFRGLLAGTSVGKSKVAMMDICIMLTGEIPVSMRYPAGFVTNVKRARTIENLKRFGRFDKISGKYIDDGHGVDILDGKEEWDCGYVVGVGRYPDRKIAAPGSEIWIGTTMKAKVEYWWPHFADPANLFLPRHLIDTRRGVNGYRKEDGQVYLVRDTNISIITYESGFNRFEAKRVHACACDEEPEDERIVHAAQQHAEYFSLVETPYLGMTYSKRLLFPEEVSPQIRVFHATQYDSPYQDLEKLNARRAIMNPWEVGARVWGFHTEMRGEPYFQRAKISEWLNRFTLPFKRVKFIPNEEYYGISESVGDFKCLMDVDIRTEETDKDDLKATWKVYEDVKPNTAYLTTVDPAEGGETPDEAADVCAALIMRLQDDDPNARPVIVASLRSTLQTVDFARAVMHAMRYYNNAVLAAETRRGACNAAFASEARTWPYWYKMTTLNDATQKQKTHNGFDTNAATRGSIFSLIEEWIGSFSETEYPQIPDRALLKELAACVKGKNGRPDHTKDGTLDTTICFGIGLFVFKHSRDQVTFNGIEEVEHSERRSIIRDIFAKQNSSDPLKEYLGGAMPVWRG